MNKTMKFADTEVHIGERKKINIPVATLFDHTEMNLPIEVIRGKKNGPTLFIAAAIHGDEINGVEIVRRILMSSALKKISGTLIAVPIVNIYGFNNNSRYLPDRRDLNRVFPGSPTGSLASRLAYIFMNEIVQKCTHGIDLHSGSNHRENYPHIRASLSSPKTKELAKLFGVSLIIDANLRDSSLRQAAFEKDIPMLLFEGGSSLRFEEHVIRIGVRGILNVMMAIGMLPKDYLPSQSSQVSTSNYSSWVRSPCSGIVRTLVKLGANIKVEQKLAVISGPFGTNKVVIYAPIAGTLIGMSKLPLVNDGDAIFHIAGFKKDIESKNNIYKSDQLVLEDFKIA